MTRRPPNHSRTRSACSRRPAPNIDLEKTYWLVVLRLSGNALDVRPYQKRITLRQAVAEVATHAKQLREANPEGRTEGLVFKRRLADAELSTLLGTGMEAVQAHPAFAMLLGEDHEAGEALAAEDAASANDEPSQDDAG